MRVFFWIILLFMLVMFGGKIINLIMSGKIFEPGEFNKVFHESGKNLWWGMKVFVVLWFAYLIFIWWVRHR